MESQGFKTETIEAALEKDFKSNNFTTIAITPAAYRHTAWCKYIYLFFYFILFFIYLYIIFWRQRVGLSTLSFVRASFYTINIYDKHNFSKILFV